jgi:hypothetical protein
MLFIGSAGLISAIFLGIGWIRSNARPISLLEIDGQNRMLTIREQSHIEAESCWIATRGGQIKYLDLPTWIIPAGFLIAAFGCFWIARSASQPRFERDQIDAADLTAATSPSAS